MWLLVLPRKTLITLLVIKQHIEHMMMVRKNSVFMLTGVVVKRAIIEPKKLKRDCTLSFVGVTV